MSEKPILETLRGSINSLLNFITPMGRDLLNLILCHEFAALRLVAISRKL